MKVFVLTTCLVMGLSQGLSAQEDYMEVSRKIWAKHSKCVGSQRKKSMDYFEERSSECLKANPSYALDRCDDIAEQKMFEWEESEEYKRMCKDSVPTTFTPSDDKYGIAYVGAAGGMMARNEGEYKVAVKILEECIEIGDLECFYRLGQVKLFADESVLDVVGAVKLLKYASERGHAGALKEIDFLKSKGLRIKLDYQDTNN